MIRTKLAAVAAAAMLLAYASPADAQRYNFDFGVHGGMSVYSPMLTDGQIGGSAGDVKFEHGPFAGVQFTWWGFPRMGFLPGPRVGLRANGTVTDRGLDQSVSGGENTTLYGHVNLWTLTGDLMFGFNSPRETWSGMEVLPYVALGIGAKWINPAYDPFMTTDAEEGKSWSGVPFTCNATGACTGPGGIMPGASTAWFLGEQGVLAGLIGLGTDLRMAPNIGLRLEIGDRIWNPPLYQANRPTTLAGLTNSTIPDDSRDGKTIHELYGQVGVHMLFGLSAPPVVAVVAPAPPPVVTRPTPPPPAPREDAIRVCVIDPSGDIRMVDALFLPASGDTLVTVNGQRVALRSTTGNVMVASNATWFVQGQPMMLHSGEQAGFVSFGSSRIVQSTDLSYLGTVNGVPVYADRDDVRDIESDMRDLRRAQNRNDIRDIVDERADIRTKLAELRVLYVPLQVTGCVFQPLQRQEQVRKVRG